MADLEFLRHELEAGIAEHSSVPRFGNYKPANERIGRVTMQIDDEIIVAGLWPRGRVAISNETRLSIIGEIQSNG